MRLRSIAIQIFMHLYHCLKKSGRPQEWWNRDDVRSAVKALPLHQKRTIQSITTALEILKLSLFCMKQNKEKTVIIPKSITVKREIIVVWNAYSVACHVCDVKISGTEQSLCSSFLQLHSCRWEVVLYFEKATAGMPCSRWRNAGTKRSEPRSLHQGNVSVCRCSPSL